MVTEANIIGRFLRHWSILVLLGFLLLIFLLGRPIVGDAAWVDPLEAPPGSASYITQPLFTDNNAQAKAGDLSLGGNLFIGAAGGLSNFCLHDDGSATECHATLLDTLAAGNTFLGLSPAVAEVGTVNTVGNKTIYHLNCVGSPCGEPGVDSGATITLGDDSDLVPGPNPYTLYRGQAPIEIVFNFLDSVAGQSNFEFVFEMNDLSALTVSNVLPGAGSQLVTIPGIQAQDLVVDTSSAIAEPTPNRIRGIFLDNSGTADIDIKTITVSWVPNTKYCSNNRLETCTIGPDCSVQPAECFGNQLRSVTIGPIPPLKFDFSSTAWFGATPFGLSSVGYGFLGEANTANPPFESYGLRSIVENPATVAVFGEDAGLTPYSGALKSQGDIISLGLEGDVVQFDKDKNNNPQIYSLLLRSGSLRLLTTTNDGICLYGSTSEECLNNWYDLETLYGTTGSTLWTQDPVDEEHTYLTKFASGQVTVGGKASDRDAVFTFNPEQNKLVIGLPSAGPHSFTCGDGACNSAEVCGSNDIAPACNTDCGGCTDIPPPNVQNMNVSKNNTVSLKVAFLAPTILVVPDYAGTLIVHRRDDGYPSFTPTDGQAYTIGQDFSGDIVRFNGAYMGSTLLVDSGLSNTVNYCYVAFTYDVALNYANGLPLSETGDCETVGSAGGGKPPRPGG